MQKLFEMVGSSKPRKRNIRLKSRVGFRLGLCKHSFPNMASPPYVLVSFRYDDLLIAEGKKPRDNGHALLISQGNFLGTMTSRYEKYYARVREIDEDSVAYASAVNEPVFAFSLQRTRLDQAKRQEVYHCWIHDRERDREGVMSCKTIVKLVEPESDAEEDSDSDDSSEKEVIHFDTLEKALAYLERIVFYD